MQNLVIVESPAKSRILARFLGDQYRVEASMGHIRDLPKSEMGVDLENNFEPRYIVPRDKVKHVNQLKKLTAGIKTLWLATDPDREGEAIAWHLKELLTENKKGKKTADIEVKRVVFHEITPEAIQEAFNDPREIDEKLVDAQQARRVLDRIVGYKLSPLLWKKVKGGLSAGRVQSVALRLIVEREKEIEAFKPVEYWSIEAELEAGAEKQTSRFIAELIEKNNKKLIIRSEIQAKEHLAILESSQYQVSKVTQKEIKKHPAPPFTTSTMQQSASNKLGMTAKKTMMIAQNLYEQGLITYMRTDSVNLSTQAITQAREVIKSSYGEQYLPVSSRIFKTKSKVAQEAHEAIRPTNLKVTPQQIQSVGGLTDDHIKLYIAIWKRMMASQMADAVMDQLSIDVSTSDYLFRATGSTIKFDGWMKLYELPKSKVKDASEESESDELAVDEKIQLLPRLEEGQKLQLIVLHPGQHFTQPAARYNDASLIKKLEELGIGRPSTYAPTISTISDRYYIERVERRFVPTVLGKAVIEFLAVNFSEIIDYSFTAEMEDNLDSVANGEKKWKPMLQEFYQPFEKKIEAAQEHADRVQIAVEKIDEDCPDCGKPLLVRFGKYGKFLACSGFPDCKYSRNMEEKIDTPCPDCGGEILVRKTRKGRQFYGCKNWPTCKYASWIKPGEQKKAATEAAEIAS